MNFDLINKLLRHAAAIGALIVGHLAVPSAFADVTFGPGVVTPTPGGGVDIALADLDSDGDLDIISLEGLFSGGAIGFINVLINRGDGTFDGPQTTDLGAFAGLELFINDLVAGDLDGDGDVDLAFIGTIAPLTLLLNNGDGTLAPPVETSLVVDLSFLTAVLDIGDLDGDGDLDLAFGQPGTVALNDGTGAFETAVFVNDSNGQQIQIVELNGDSIADIAFGFRTHVNDGSALFTQAGTITAAAGAPDCAFGDFDGDGDNDAACARSFANELGIALNNGDATFTAPVFLPTTDPRRVLAANLNGDAHLDLVVSHLFCGAGCSNPDISVLVGRGDGTFEDPLIIETSASQAIAVGDLNDDGLDDIVVATSTIFSNGGLNILLNTTQPVGIPGDVNGDCAVNVLDLIELLLAFGSAGGPADLNLDGAVNVLDLIELLLAFGSTCP